MTSFQPVVESIALFSDQSYGYASYPSGKFIEDCQNALSHDSITIVDKRFTDIWKEGEWSLQLSLRQPDGTKRFQVYRMKPDSRFFLCFNEAFALRGYTIDIHEDFDESSLKRFTLSLKKASS